MERMIAHKGTAAGLCTRMSGNARVVACKLQQHQIII